MRVIPIPANADNYQYLIIDSKSNKGAIVDPVDVNGIRALKTPCHTSTHICYYITDEAENQKCVFTGDTLFIGGCGRFFEGTAEEMNYALNENLGKLPDDTKVYCGHEYTIKNLEFALSIEPNNPNILSKVEWAKNLRKQNGFTVPSTIGEEKAFNPFMRVNNFGIQEKLGTLYDPIATMQKLRDLKNKF
uniref:hydroxyacylglutathione hydrolase n=1 Tax=Meloidogyne javanica TaxID=6303 RepID=A0A915N6R3_MELJA